MSCVSNRLTSVSAVVGCVLLFADIGCLLLWLGLLMLVQFGPRLTGDVVEHIGARDVAELVAVSCTGCPACLCYAADCYRQHHPDLKLTCSSDTAVLCNTRMHAAYGLAVPQNLPVLIVMAIIFVCRAWVLLSLLVSCSSWV